MYKVLIADDEYLSRFVVKTIISRKMDTLEIAGEAENGRQAIEMSRKLMPHIVIMDIKMPGINGIDAAKEIISEFPGTCVLILTAYDNFDYIKRALDMGVKGYILKPVKEEEVVDKVTKLIKELDERSDKLNFEQQFANKIKVIRPLIENELISSFVSGKFDMEKAENYTNFLQIEINSGYFMLISPGLGFSRDINEAIRYRIIKDRIYTIAEKHLPLMKRCYFGNSIGNTIVVFFPVEGDEIKGDIYSKEAILIGEEIKSRIKIISNIDVAVGIGRVYSNIQNLTKSYDEAGFALKKAARDRKVVYFGNIGDECSEESHVEYPIDLESRLVDQIKIGNMENARALADEIVDNILENNCTIDSIKECLAEFITVLKRSALRIGVNSSSLVDPEWIAVLSELNTLEEVNIWCKRNMYNLLEAIENKSGRSREVISKAFEYINRHFNKDITLEMVAGEIGISPQYLSKTFKEKYGSNFIDYITGKRVEYAQKLLCSSNMNIKEISQAVGYGDPYYFCKIFKKDTGLTPKQFRAQKNTGET